MYFFQRATLAEKEVNTLKEQLTMNNMPGSTSPPLPIITQNGIPPPSPSTTPLSDSSMTGTPISGSKLLNNNENSSNFSNNNKKSDNEMIEKMEINDESDAETDNIKNRENAENEIEAALADKRSSCRKSPTMENSCSENLSNLSLNSSSRMNINNNDSKNSDNNNTTKKSSSDKSLTEQLADKDREVSHKILYYFKKNF